VIQIAQGRPSNTRETRQRISRFILVKMRSKPYGHGYGVPGVGGVPGIMIGGPGIPFGPGGPGTVVEGVPGVPGV
jgi:hypothetical protein